MKKSKPPKKSPPVADGDKTLFRQANQGVRRLKQNSIAPYRQPRKAIPEQSMKDEQDVIENLLSDEFDPAEIESGEELLFVRGGLQHSVIKKLKRGHYIIEAELDLHRLTVIQARERLVMFLRHVTNKGQRCIRIIHGKGLGSAGGLPILKNKVNSWLQQRDEVMAFCSAQPRDGGTGAVYVLLKRK